MKNRLAIIQLFIANTISGIAQGISMIAIPWYFAKTGNAVNFGWMYWAATVLSVFWVPVCGMLVDKYDRKKLFLWFNSACGLLILSVAFWGLQTGDLDWYWVGFVFVLTFFNYNIHFPALYAFAQEITEPKYYGKITSLLEIVQQSTTVLAGACAAFLLEGSHEGILKFSGLTFNFGLEFQAWKIHEIFLLDGLTYLISFLIILFIKYKSLTERKQETGSLQDRIKIGVNWLKQHPKIFIFGTASHSVFAVVMVLVFYLNAVYVSDYLNTTGDVFASSESFFAIGAVFAGIAIRRIFKAISIPFSVAIMTGVTAGLMLILFLTKAVSLFYIAIFLLGLCNAGVRIQRVTFIFQKIPNQVIGRTGSIFRIFNIIIRATFIGVFSLVFFTNENVVNAYLIMSIFLFIAFMVLVWNSRQLAVKGYF